MRPHLDENLAVSGPISIIEFLDRLPSHITSRYPKRSTPLEDAKALKSCNPGTLNPRNPRCRTWLSSPQKPTRPQGSRTALSVQHYSRQSLLRLMDRTKRRKENMVPWRCSKGRKEGAVGLPTRRKRCAAIPCRFSKGRKEHSFRLRGHESGAVPCLCSKGCKKGVFRSRGRKGGVVPCRH